MTNSEFNKKDLNEIVSFYFGVDKKTNEIKDCEALKCCDCLFGEQNHCIEQKLKWLKEEHVEPVVLSFFEKETLRRLKISGFKYLAKDKNGDLYAYRSSPVKEGEMWADNQVYYYFHFDVYFADFEFVHWEDELPYSIDELLGAEE